MMVEIDSLDNGSGVNTKLNIYKVYNTKQRLTDNRPYCIIEQDKFFELLNNPEKEFEKACEGKIHFNVSITDLDEACIKIY